LFGVRPRLRGQIRKPRPSFIHAAQQRTTNFSGIIARRGHQRGTSDSGSSIRRFHFVFLAAPRGEALAVRSV